MRQSGERRSVSAISYKEKTKKDNDIKRETRVYGWGFGSFRQFQVALASGQVQVQTNWPLLDYPSIPSWKS